MYDVIDKRRLYWVLDYYLSGNIDEDSLSDELNRLFTLDDDRLFNSLTETEYEAFDAFNDVVQRFSPYEEDQKLWAFTAEYVRQKALETKERLKDQYPF